MQAAVAELQSQGYDIPDYPEDPKNDAGRELQARFAKVLGSAVNPVLREGNSDRRAAAAVKQFARKHPHQMMKDWPKSGSQTRVAHMEAQDFFGSETSVTSEVAGDVRIEFVDDAGSVTLLKDRVTLEAGEIIDVAAMNVAALRTFFGRTIDEARQKGLLLSLHLKATMMKVSDPVMFGHCVAAAVTWCW